MIITRYISRQILQSTMAITVILVVVVAFGRLLNYLSKASKGELDPSLLMQVMAYKMPDFLQLILPLALLLGILLTLGRLYADSEMTVLIASGMSQLRLLLIIMVGTVLVAGLVACLSLQFAPQGSRKVSELVEVQQNLSEFDLIAPGLFQNIAGSRRTTYVEAMADGEMRQVFMLDAANNRVIKAESAMPIKNDDGSRFVRFRHGTVTAGLNTQNDYALTQFDEMGIRLAPRELGISAEVEEKTLTTAQLLASPQLSHKAELQWRLSLILSVPVLSLFAVPLARVSPRQGRYAKLLPGIVIYLTYLGLMLLSRTAVANGKLPVLAGLWWVHALFLLFGLLLFTGKLQLSRSARRV